MNLTFDLKLAKNYKSKSQIARVLSENWVLKNSYCPSCGEENLNNYPNNKPVADFYCKRCHSEFELKSKSGSFGIKVINGAYEKIVDRIKSYTIPNFFFLNYSIKYYAENFLVIPSHFFSIGIIEKRSPLADNARRAGWIGCNILLQKLPDTSRIYLLKEGKVIPKREVIYKWNKTAFLKYENLHKRGWLIEIIACIDRLQQIEFSLMDIYEFETHLKKKYPRNKFIKEKIRQQLQVLRDKGYIEFLGRGKYRKL